MEVGLQEGSPHEVEVEGFNKLSVNLFDSGLIVSIVDAYAQDIDLVLDLYVVDLWSSDKSEEAKDSLVSIEVSVHVNLETGELMLSSSFGSENQDQLNEVTLIGGVLSILGIRDEEANLVVAQDENEVRNCALVVKERLIYLVGEAMIQFGTRWRKMVNPSTFSVDDDAVEVIMPEFPGEAEVLQFGMFLVSEASRINELLTGDDDPESDEETESGFGFINAEADDRPLEERLREAIVQAATNKTLH